MITELPPVVVAEAADRPSGLGADHPMRTVTRAVAFDPAAWNDETRATVRSLFDSLAPDWNTRDVPGRDAPLVDALDRGIAAAPVAVRRRAVDVGGGTGITSKLLAGAFPSLTTVDLSSEMLRRAPADQSQRVQGDGSVLPLTDGATDALVLSNMFLFPGEADRVLAPTGVLVWVNSRGTDTPIHLTANEVDQALPGSWNGVASQAGRGTWSVHWRDLAG